jgi:hypothetical protein
MTSMDRRHPFSAHCLALVVSLQGCGLRASQSLPIKTPVLLAELPGAVTASGHIASCLPLGNDGKYFLIGVSLYNPGNIWGIVDPPEDWNCASSTAEASSAERPANKKEAWPYNLHSGRGAAHSRLK